VNNNSQPTNNSNVKSDNTYVDEMLVDANTINQNISEKKGTSNLTASITNKSFDPNDRVGEQIKLKEKKNTTILEEKKEKVITENRDSKSELLQN